MRCLVIITSSVIIDDFDLFRIPIVPFKTNAPLVIDADAPLSLSTPLQRFESVGWRQTQIFKLESRINGIKCHESPLLNIMGKRFGKLAMKYLFGFPTAK
jgi:hypothetical protein